MKCAKIKCLPVAFDVVVHGCIAVIPAGVFGQDMLNLSSISLPHWRPNTKRRVLFLYLSITVWLHIYWPQHSVSCHEIVPICDSKTSQAQMYMDT